VGVVTLPPLSWDGKFSDSRERKGKTIVILFIQGAGNRPNLRIEGRHVMKRLKSLPVKIRILIIVAVIVVAVGVTAYIKFSPTTTDTYKLTHSAADAEYILS